MVSEESREGPWTIIKLLTWTEGYFKKFNVDSPRLTSEILLSHLLNIRRLDLYLQFDRPLNPDELTRYRELIQRRVKEREPVAYITESKGFWHSDFFVSPHVLIPRPDTETLVEQSILAINQLHVDERPLKVLELGTGSGAIIISLAKECPEHSFFAADLSIPAIGIASKNAFYNDLKSPCGLSLIHFWAGSWLESVRPGVFFDIIISNPPYIPSGDIYSLQAEIRDHEPVMALDGGSDGLDCFRTIMASSVHFLSPGGSLLMEMGFDQKILMEKEALFFPQYNKPSFVKDYAEHDRVVVLTLK